MEFKTGRLVIFYRQTEISKEEKKKKRKTNTMSSSYFLDFLNTLCIFNYLWIKLFFNTIQLRYVYSRLRNNTCLQIFISLYYLVRRLKRPDFFETIPKLWKLIQTIYIKSSFIHNIVLSIPEITQFGYIVFVSSCEYKDKIDWAA